MAGVLPDSVTIDSMVYAVKLVGGEEMLHLTRNDSCLGYVVHTKNTIYILDTMAVSAQEAVLVHEALHVLDCNHDLSLRESDVKTLGVTIPAFLKANGFWHNSHAKEAKRGKPKR
jgi:hypothetical protein